MASVRYLKTCQNILWSKWREIIQGSSSADDLTLLFFTGCDLQERYFTPKEVPKKCREGWAQRKPQRQIVRPSTIAFVPSLLKKEENFP
ncbi:hypothetical protein CDAR_223841 [Caerostris darwini]|uniref:Uncharacterized protein n=1 Tax=Caerostris darwini TaxID=1538125 RepID=A0AAV4S0L7_9ARAC|nr:hypothetical protein CDAR_223841 [Caerostris darwini]